VAEEMDLPKDWLNDGAKGFLSPQADFEKGALPQFSNLRLQTATPEYLLAMKVLASRAATLYDRGDRDDIALLLERLGIRSADAALAIVRRYYPETQLLPRSLYLLEEILESRGSDK